jgi:hypothetical protein
VNELHLDGYVAGKTVTARIFNGAGQCWHVAGAAFEAYGAGGHAASSYNTAETDKGGGAYRGTIPAGILTLADADYTVQHWDSAITTQAVGLQELSVREGAVVSLFDAVAAVDAGSGDYAVTVTIRATGGTVVPGARVWLSTDGNREHMATGTLVTDDGGQVVFQCDYGTAYYLHCHLAGYAFASANFTPAAGSVSFTKDIATAVSASGSASDYAQSFLVRLLDVVRTMTGEPQINKKYSDDWIIERAENTYALALGEKYRMEQDPLVARIPITVDGSEVYVLPSTIGPIQAVYYDAGYGAKVFYRRSGNYNINGKGVWVEGNLLRLQDGLLALGQTITVEAWPAGLARLHCGTCTLDATGTIATFGATPYQGTLDRQINAYLGSMFRLFHVTGTGATGDYVQERPISTYDVTTRQATLEKALDPIPAAGTGGYLFYEIAPAIPIGLDSIIGLRVAWEINSVEGQVKKAQGCLVSYTQNLRHLRLSAFCSQLQSAGQVDGDTFQSSQNSGRVYG